MTNVIPIDAGLAYDDLYPDGRISMGLDNDEFIGFGDIPIDYTDYLQISNDGRVTSAFDTNVDDAIEIRPAVQPFINADIAENILEDQEQVRSISGNTKNKNVIQIPEEFPLDEFSYVDDVQQTQGKEYFELK